MLDKNDFYFFGEKNVLENKFTIEEPQVDAHVLRPRVAHATCKMDLTNNQQVSMIMRDVDKKKKYLRAQMGTIKYTCDVT